MEVSEVNGLANWMNPDNLVKIMGGAMDLAAGLKRVVVATDCTNTAHIRKNLSSCPLPHKGKTVVNRSITNLSTHYIIESGLKIVECADGVTEEDIKTAREAKIISAKCEDQFKQE
jgi:3-oxoacid CoA-transferase subunit B